MRLLPGYTSAPALTRAVVVDAVAFEVLTPSTSPARYGQSAPDLLRARTAIELYSRVGRLNEQPMGMLNLYS